MLKTDYFNWLLWVGFVSIEPKTHKQVKQIVIFRPEALNQGW